MPSGTVNILIAVVPPAILMLCLAFAVWFERRKERRKDQLQRQDQHHGQHHQDHRKQRKKQQKQLHQQLDVADMLGIIIERTGPSFNHRDLEMIELGANLQAGTARYPPISYPIPARLVPGRVYEDEKLEGIKQLQALPKAPAAL